MYSSRVKLGICFGWMLIALVAMGLTIVPLTASAAPPRPAQRLAKTCYKTVRVCRKAPMRVCQAQRYCQPTHVCTRSRIGNRIVEQCRRICRWLTRQYCRLVNRIRCRQVHVAAICAVRD